MSRHMEDVREMLCEELDKIAQQGELTAGSLDTVDKLTHAIKSIDTIMAMGGYSNAYYGGNSYSRRSRDSMGRYSRDYRGNSYRGYSYDDAKDHIIDQLEGIMDSAQDEESKRIIQKAIDKLEK